MTGFSGKKKVGKKRIFAFEIFSRLNYIFGMIIHIKNLSGAADETDLLNIFSKYGLVISAVIRRPEGPDERTGEGFIEMPVASHARKAVSAVNGMIFKGYPIIMAV